MEETENQTKPPMVALSHPSSICASSFSKAVHREKKKEHGYLPRGLVELFAATSTGPAVYMDTLSVAAHTGSAPDLCKELVQGAKKYHGPCKAPVTEMMGIEGTQLQI